MTQFTKKLNLSLRKKILCMVAFGAVLFGAIGCAEIDTERAEGYLYNPHTNVVELSPPALPLVKARPALLSVKAR